MLGWSMLAKYGVLWFYDSPRIYFQIPGSRENKPEKNMFDTPVTARKLLNSPSLQTLITGIKRYTRTNSSINHHFFSPICYFWNFFPTTFPLRTKKHRCRRRFHWRNPSSAIGSRSRCRDPVRLHHGGTHCTVAGGTEARGRGTGDQLRHDTRESTGNEFGLLKTHPREKISLEKSFNPPGNVDLSFCCCTWLICVCGFFEPQHQDGFGNRNKSEGSHQTNTPVFKLF